MISTLSIPGTFCLVNDVNLSLYTLLIYQGIRKGSMNQSAIIFVKNKCFSLKHDYSMFLPS